MKRLLMFIACCTFLAVSASAAGNTAREKYNFNPGWKVFVGDPEDAANENFDDADWKEVTLPHAWNEDYAFKVAINQMPRKVAWYRKSFKLPASAQGQKIFFEFEGLRQAGKVFLNGEEVMLHENGVMAFGIDVTDAVRFGNEENILAVRVDSNGGYREESTGVSFQWNHGAFNVNYGGLNKNVILHVLPRVYQTLPLYSDLGTTGVYIYASDINIDNASAVINAESEIKNESPSAKTLQYSVQVRDMDGKLVAGYTGESATVNPGQTITLSASQKVDGLNFWSWGYGYLYNVTTTLKEDGKVIDEVTTRTGFRKTQFGEGMIWLNDRVIQMKGFAQRSTNEWPAIGSSVPAWLSDYSNQLVVEGNGNLIRWMHVTPWKQDVESCDRVGLIHAMPAGDSEKDVQGRQWEQRVELMRDAIIYNRNNPSILFYECGNKRISYEHMEEMKAVRDKYDPHGGRAIGSREMLDIDNAEWGGEMLYINHSAKHPMWATEYMRDEGLRKYWDDYSYPFHKHGDGPLYRNEPAATYNQNQDKLTVENVRRWFDYYEARPGTGRRVSSGGVKIIFSDSNTHQRGAENYRRSGVVDPMRIPKDGYWAHKVMWDGWVDLDNYNTYIVGHWNYPAATVKDIYVVSAAPQVKLFVNDKPAGGEAVKEYHFLNTFKNVAFEQGTIKAVSYDENGKELSSYEIETAGEPAAIRLTPMTSPGGMLADGQDLALIEVEVVDAQGRRCPLANDVINFQLEGPAEWRGGIAQGPDNYILSQELPVECGVNRVFVRSAPKAGKITLKATSGSLKPATISIKTKKVKVKDGLSQTFQADVLPSYMEKGPTPKTPSYTVSRNAIEVASVKAGSNEENGARSFDDNEVSQWTNDGQLATAWISYTLEREAELSEICAKFAGWRTSSYPIEVFVDGKKVWAGNTGRSLGYVTLRFDPVRGKDVMIRLVGRTSEEDAFGAITEVDPNVDLDIFRNTSDPNAQGQLRIVEIEFYEKAK